MNAGEFKTICSRREWLRKVSGGFGSLAFLSLLAEEAAANEKRTNPLAARTPPLPAKAKRVVQLFMNGGPSHIDMLDPKPLVNKLHGKSFSQSGMKSKRPLGQFLASPFKFEKHGQSGIEVSELLPYTAKFVDDLCVVRSMKTEAPDHSPGMLMTNCGHIREVRPSMGAWITYGLGTENQNLPAYIALCPNGYPTKAQENWHAAFLPGIFQGSYIDTSASDFQAFVPNLRNPYLSRSEQRRQMDLVQAWNRSGLERLGSPDPLDTRMQAYELAFHMQSEAMDAFDISKEPQEVRERYGFTQQGNQYLLARRLLERGVRFVQVYHGFDKPWDSHTANAPIHKRLCNDMDQPTAALLHDLKEKGMLQDTLVVWGGEFGRSSTAELPLSGADTEYTGGRDHNPNGFTMWLAGGGVKAGTVVGATDDAGINAVETPVDVHDLHATILALLGLDHTKLTYPHEGRDIRLTDGFGRVVREIIA